MECRAPLYPIFLSLQNQHCLVVGLGEVGLRKLAGILAAEPASVLALDTAKPSVKAQSLLEDYRIHFEQRTCREEDITAKILVLAATGDKGENARIADLCQKMGVLCNCAAPSGRGNVFLPAVARKGRLAVALSTGGASPVLARQWRGELEDWLEPRQRMALLLGRLRPLLLDLPGDAEENKRLLRKLAASPLQQWLAEGDAESSLAWLVREMPIELHAHLAPALTELFDDLP